MDNVKNRKFSAFCIAATHSGGGKTTITLGLLRVLYNRGLSVGPFKCGPDYIDPTFHRYAAKKESINLDTWMMKSEGVKTSWANHCASVDVSVVEGVMGLFDSRSIGSLDGSTADCARILDIPVVLIIDAKGMAGSIAAMVKGFMSHSNKISICGIIANRVGSKSHAKILSDALEHDHLPPLIGAVPKHSDWILPERHLGLVPFLENEKSEEWFDNIAEVMEETVNIDLLLKLSSRPIPSKPLLPKFKKRKKTIAYAFDKAFYFYYPDTLLMLKRIGYNLITFSPLNDSKLPSNTDILYIGGGFPESFGEKLNQNESMRKAIRQYANDGGIIYAECGGFMYLSNKLKNSDGKCYEMCGVIDGQAEMNPRLRSLGYREAIILGDMPFGKKEDRIRGHEFHWSDMSLNTPYKPLFKVIDSKGNTKNVGVRNKNVFASYIHLHLAFNDTVIENLTGNNFPG